MDLKLNVQSLIGVALGVFGVYSFVEVHWVDGLLYLCTGIAFFIMAALKQNWFEDYKGALTIASWVFIAASLFFFLFRLMMDSLGI